MRNFRRILCTVLAFLLLVSALSVGFMEVYFRTEYDFFQDGSERDSLAGSLDYLVCGASHAYRAFNPAVMDPILGAEGYNISGALMTMGGRYELFTEELGRNPVKTLILELSYNTMTRNRAAEGTEGDLYVMARLSGFFRRVRFFFGGFRVSEYPDVYYKFVSEGIDAVRDLIRGKQAEHSGRSRGYMPTGESVTELETDYAALWHGKHLSQTMDPYNLDYLNRILTLCRERGIRVILVTTPLADAYLCQYDNFQYFYEWYTELAAQWELTYYDFNLLKEKSALFPDRTFYFDHLHLNDAGAEKYSKVFAELLLRAQAGEDLSELFYASYPEMEQQVFGLGA